MDVEVESQGLEFKREISNFKEISKTVCAFANASSGRILVGVDDSGKTVGIQPSELDSLQQRIEGAIQQVAPQPMHKINVEERDGKKIIAVDVFQMGQGSFCTFDGIVYYRTGSQNSKLEGKTLQDYMVKRRILYFDEAVSKAQPNEVDPEKLKSFLKKRSPSLDFDEKKINSYLSSLNLLYENGGICLINAAVLFFAKEPGRFIPQNELKLVRFKGTTPVDIIDSKYANSTIVENLKEAEDFIKRNTQTRFKIEKVIREEVPEYPQNVVREALVNSIVHRDYFSRDAIQINIFDDRIEFINPGVLQSGLSIQILGTLSIQRNPIIYRLMRDLGMMEGFATGVPRMRAGMREAGLMEPRFEELGNFFRVTLYNNSHLEDGNHNDRQKRGLAFLSNNPQITSKKYMELTGVSHPIAVSELNDLCSTGLLKKIGKTRGSYYTLVKSRQ